MWIATVFNINFPSSPAASAAEQRAELEALVDAVADAGLNAVFFQVRPESDALYASELEPWSRFLTGEQGIDPGYDPLAHLLEVAHARAIEVHAWLNPYRAKASRTSYATPGHLSNALAQHTVIYGNLLWMDPGAVAVQDHVVAVVDDLATRYDVDGIHFDDYFYPYPDGTEFADDASYQAYRASGGAASRGDWRRDNVNTLLRRISERLAVSAPHVRFGVSPFGIYRPGQPPGITGLDQYAEIYADPVAWKANRWVHYLAPQLYWPSTQTAQAFGALVDWWSALGDASVPTYAGCNLEKLGSSAAWSLDEFRTQVELTRAAGAHGNVYYHVEPILEDRAGIRGLMRELYATPAWPPALGTSTPPAPRVEDDERGVSVSGEARAWAVYREQGDAWVAERIVSGGERQLALSSGRWAVSALHRDGSESLAVVVER